MDFGQSELVVYVQKLVFAFVSVSVSVYVFVEVCEFAQKDVCVFVGSQVDV